MNTKTCNKEHFNLFNDHLWRLMFEDGFFVHEALDHVPAYAICIFGNASPTAQLRIRTRLRVIEREAMNH